ncbi:MAG: rRNA maturation RNase YbeY [Burkholderiales bacterium]|nr:rRNA maturation RNase YbeY [Burkholderiales bacterium]
MAAQPKNAGLAASAAHRRPAAPKASLSLSLQYAVPLTGLPTRAEFRRWIMAALAHRGPLDKAEITVRIVDETEGRALNRDFRSRDYATNVLTFVYSAQTQLCGDIALCAAVVAREAHEREIALHAHYAHLAVHGALHLQGYDHEVDSDAEIMEALETATLAKLGFPDPYAGDKPGEVKL